MVCHRFGFFMAQNLAGNHLGGSLSIAGNIGGDNFFYAFRALVRESKIPEKLRKIGGLSLA
jgi:hypothetical protein